MAQIFRILSPAGEACAAEGGSSPVARLFLCMLFFLQFLLFSPAWAGTTVERGDLLNVEVMDAEMFSRQARVDADGVIMLPALGGLTVAGNDLDQIRNIIASELEAAGLLRRPVVLVEFAEYRPVYVGGAVAKPGVVEYLPGMTAQQAVIAAGGLSLRTKEDDIAPEALIEAVARSQAVAFQLVQTKARIVRLKAALTDSENLEAETLTADSLPSKTVTEVVGIERRLLRDQLDRKSSQRTHGRALEALLDLELEILSRQAELQEEESVVQTEELTNAKKLVDQGLMPRPRLQELMREKSRLSRDLLETRAYAARAEQAKETARFELADKEAVTRISLRRELQETERDKVRIEAELQALRARLLTVGLATSIDNDSALAAPEPRLVVRRDNARGLDETAVAPGDPVQPGDVLEVMIDTALPG